MITIYSILLRTLLPSTRLNQIILLLYLPLRHHHHHHQHQHLNQIRWREHCNSIVHTVSDDMEKMKRWWDLRKRKRKNLTRMMNHSISNKHSPVPIPTPPVLVCRNYHSLIDQYYTSLILV